MIMICSHPHPGVMAPLRATTVSTGYTCHHTAQGWIPARQLVRPLLVAIWTPLHDVYRKLTSHSPIPYLLGFSEEWSASLHFRRIFATRVRFEIDILRIPRFRFSHSASWTNRQLCHSGTRKWAFAAWYCSAASAHPPRLPEVIQKQWRPAEGNHHYVPRNDENRQWTINVRWLQIFGFSAFYGEFSKFWY